LFFANKMDIAGCLSPFECCASLGLDDIKSKPWHITYALAARPCCSCCCTHKLRQRQLDCQFDKAPDVVARAVKTQSLLWTDR
jgi:hypothetical protein